MRKKLAGVIGTPCEFFLICYSSPYSIAEFAGIIPEAVFYFITESQMDLNYRMPLLCYNKEEYAFCYYNYTISFRNRKRA
jgi:hypothetical protein